MPYASLFSGIYKASAPNGYYFKEKNEHVKDCEIIILESTPEFMDYASKVEEQLKSYQIPAQVNPSKGLLEDLLKYFYDHGCLFALLILPLNIKNNAITLFVSFLIKFT